MKYTAKVNDRIIDVEIAGEGDSIEVKIDGQLVDLDFQRIKGTNIYSLIFANRSYQLWIQPDGGKYVVGMAGRTFPVEIEDEKARLLKQLVRAEKKKVTQEFVKAPMPGLVVKLQVKVDQQVKKGDGLVIVEAMKMENEIRSPVDGVIKEIRVKEKESIEKDAVLMVIG